MSATEYYNSTGTPSTGAQGASASMRAEFDLVEAGFGKLPDLAGNSGKAVIINGGGTGMSVTVGTLALAGNFSTTGAFNTILAQGASVTITLPLVNGTLATLAGTEVLSNKTLTAPALGTPLSGVLTNCTGTASGLTAGSVTTNANLTGHVTSSGNAAVLGSFTLAQLNTAVNDADVASLAGVEVLTNKTLSAASNTLNLTPITASLGADVALNNSALYFDGPSVAQGVTGTWFASGTVTIFGTHTTDITLKLWDGTTVIASTVVHVNSGLGASVSLSGFITSPVGNIRISARDSTYTSSAESLVFNLSGLSKDSTLTAIRIA